MTVNVAMSEYSPSEDGSFDSLQTSGFRSNLSSRRPSLGNPSSRRPSWGNPSSRRPSWGNPSLVGLRSGEIDPVYADDAENEGPFEESESEAEPWRPQSYIKIGEVGRGTFGTVYKCLCVDTYRSFVAKEMEACNHTYRQLAHSEINILKGMNHKRIIGYYESILEGDTVTMFIEFMSGGSVLQMIKKSGPLAESLALKYTRQVTEALEYIHERGIVHNDLKCDNLLLDSHGDLKLGDFGSAIQKTVHGSSPTFSPCETPFGVSLYWTAPEVLNYEDFTCSADIWSLGCTIVEMLTSAPPFYKLPEEEFLASVEGRVLSYDPKSLVPKASSSMQLLLCSLLQEDSGKRPQTGGAAAAKLDQIF